MSVLLGEKRFERTLLISSRAAGICSVRESRLKGHTEDTMQAMAGAAFGLSDKPRISYI